MKILITGANGQLGSHITSIINKGSSKLGKIDKSYASAQVFNLDKTILDISLFKNLKNILFDIKPNLVINCAAFTKVDACEKNIELAFKVNSLGCRNIALLSNEIDAKLIHISTDYVFAGNKSTPYREFDPPSPINIYGKTKLLGEKYIKQYCRNHFIFRTSWLYGYTGENFVKKIIKLGLEKNHLNIVADQIGTPTNVEDLTYHILKIALTNEYGLYHCSNNGSCSWFEFAKKIIEQRQINCSLNPIKTENLDQVAKRPSYSVLDNLMLRCTFRDKMRRWEDALEEFNKNLKV